MKNILLINPNTSASITALMQRHVAAAVDPATHQVLSTTARFGAPYIASETTAAVAAHSLLDAWAAWQLANASAPLDAILIGCFGDPGLMALRESASVPVIGLAEASFKEASMHGRFAIVTGGSAWKPMLRVLAYQLGYDKTLAGVHTVAPTGAELAADPDAALELLAKACRDAADMYRADAVILGGGGLAGMAAALKAGVPVPVIDSVAAGGRQAALMCGQRGTRTTPGFDAAWTGVSAEMIRLGKAPA